MYIDFMFVAKWFSFISFIACIVFFVLKLLGENDKPTTSFLLWMISSIVVFLISKKHENKL